MNPKEVMGLMGAYSKVYVSPENLQEEIQEWANSLIEEGYDLSEYTWEEMYEAYLEERRSRKGLSPEVRQERQAQANVQRAQAPTTPPRSGGGRVGRGQRARAAADSGAGGDAAYRAGGGDAAARSGRSRQEIQAAGMAAVRAKPAATPAATPAAAPKPAATPAATPTAAPTAAPKPAATPAATPTAAPKPAATPTAAPKPAATPAATSSSTTPARPSLSSQASELRQMRSRSLERQGKPAAAAAVSATAKPTAFQANSFDVFDLVKGYLLDEGYAETEEGAMVMMVNMSEGWRESILEFLGGQSGDGYIGHPRLGIKNPMSPPKKPVTSAPKNTGVAGQLGNRAAAMDAAMKQLRQSYQPEGELVDESQHARENPEDHDKEEKKKYEKVRGEKTPMPPRGDKRREDFEKWYAKNVR